MIPTAIIAVLLVAAIGVGAVYGLRTMVRRELVLSDKRITWLEYGVALAVVSVVVAPGVLILGSKAAIANALTYYELRAGTETAAHQEPNTCHPGHRGSSISAGYSNCNYSYRTDEQYSWIETYTTQENCKTVTTKSTDGKSSSSTTVCDTVTHYRTEYAYIYAPYATVEYTYTVKYFIPSDDQEHEVDYPGTYVAANPIRAGSRDIPGDVPKGPPSDWQDAKNHLDAGDPRPVKKVFSYKNYILASHDVTLAPFSLDVDRYLKQKLLPDHTANILTDPIYGKTRPLAKEISFVGVKVPDENKWQEALMRFNTALGSQRKGDLHVVVIDSKLISDPHNYLNAFRAYSLGDHFGDHALAKNGIILVIGSSDGATIDWAQADTGMPYGNNIMLHAMESHLGSDNHGGKVALDPEIIFGHPRTVIVPPKVKGGDAQVTVTLSSVQSILESTMFGPNGFVKPCMTSKNGCVGYENLVDKIQPSTGWKTGLVAIICGLSLLFWWLVAASSFMERRDANRPSNRRVRRSPFQQYRF